MALNMSIPAAFEDTLSTPEQIEWLYKNKEALLQAGANIEITRSGDRTIITAVGEGFSPTVSVEEIPGGHEVTITDGTGPHVFDVMDGLDGDDGVSPTVTITSITGGHRVVITDEDHPLGQTFDIMDGVDGSDGTSVTVKSVTPTSGGVNLVITDSAGDHTIFLANGPQGLTGPQGPTGPTGATGATGETGATPIITMTATADGTHSASPTVTVTKTGTDLNPAFALAFSGLKGETGATGATGEQGPAGQDGTDGTDGTDGVSPEVSISAITGGHRVTITDADHPSGQSFDVMDGENAAAATVTVGSTTTGEPGTNASVTNSGTSSAAVLDFVIPRGATGATGAQGPQGETGETGPAGADGVTPVITATATADATHSANPSVTVTKSGTDAAPTFAFAFSGLQGEQGAAGADGQDGAPGQGVPSGGTAGQILKKNSNTDYDTTWAAMPEGLPAYSSSDNGKVLAISPVGSVPAWENRGVPTGGTAGQVLTKNSSSNWDASWATPAAGGGSGCEEHAIGLVRNDTFAQTLLEGGVSGTTVATSSSSSANISLVKGKFGSVARGIGVEQEAYKFKPIAWLASFYFSKTGSYDPTNLAVTLASSSNNNILINNGSNGDTYVIWNLTTVLAYTGMALLRVTGGGSERYIIRDFTMSLNKTTHKIEITFAGTTHLGNFNNDGSVDIYLW